MEQTILLSIIIFVLCFIIFYLVNCRKTYLIISKKSKKKKKEIVIFPIKYLQSRFKLKEETLITINNLRMYAFLDSLIISKQWHSSNLFAQKLPLQHLLLLQFLC